MESRKGISTFIATLLLMVLAVSAGVVIYAYTMGYLGGFGGQEQLGAMSLDEATATSNNITAYIRNIGKTTIIPDRVYVDGTLYNKTSDAGSSYEFNCTPTELSENQVGKLFINGTDVFEAGKTYNVKLIAEDNTQVSFSVKAK